MEVNAQLLGGAAVTVFLALIFFGVVVLWDVALALRSVGDKIDKLEDNIDDDLTDIGHSLDNISNGRGGGGGGTQLHLNGGTISSGPNAGRARGQPTQAAQSPGARAASGGARPSEPGQSAQQPRGRSGGVGGAEATTATDSSAGVGPTRADTATGEANGAAGVAAATADAPADGNPVADGTETTAGGVAAADEPSSDLGPEPTPDGAPTAGAATADESATEAMERDSDTDAVDRETAADADAAAGEIGVDASHETDIDATADETASDRGRFVTPPDRTAWHAVQFDRDAITDAGPTIAGELTDGSETDSDDAVIAAGPVESTADVDATETDDSSETADDAVVAAPPADGEPIERESTPAVDDASNDGEPETASVDSGAGTDGTGGGDPDIGSDAGDTVAGGDDPATGERDSVPDDGGDQREADGEATESDDSRETASTPDAFAFDETEPAAGSEPTTDSEPAADSPADGGVEAATDDGDVEHDADTDAESATSDRPTTGAGLEPVDETDAGTAETDSDEGADRSDETDSETDDVAVSDDESAVDPLAGDVTAFEFDDEELEDVTVEGAVDTINEDAPAPELSSHQFDVSAEVYGSAGDDDGDGMERDDGGENTVLTYEFDTDTVEISGSTKRLLQYQLRSFADRDATPEADVTIGRDRIVIEILDSDGDAVQRWSEAAVDIIDRTLYLSDNSSDDS